MVRRRKDEAGWSALLAGAVVGSWGWRLELGLAALVIAAQRLLAGPLGELGSAVVVAMLVGAALAVGPVRRFGLRAAHSASVRRAWRRAASDVGLAVDALRVPRVVETRRIVAGDLLRVRVCRGQSVASVEGRAAEVAACLRVREVRVQPERGDAAFARVTLVRRDPFEDPAPIGWPDAGIPERSLWDPIPIGIDEHGESVEVGLVERNVLVGGEPGAGKSVALSLLVAAAALDPTARVWLLDGKLVELAAWAPVADRLVGPDAGEAIELLRDVQREMDTRYRELLARGLRKVRRDDELSLHLVVVDELAFYVTLPDRKQRQELTELLRDLVARGRAAGVIVVAATQKPGADIVPSSLRDLFGFRLALRCNTPQASDTILGQGWASAGSDASTVPGAQRGVGFLLAEGEQPIRVKAFHLDDDELAAIAERATARRADAWLASGATTNREAVG
jgi:FtsK/SpoIIIE family